MIKTKTLIKTLIENEGLDVGKFLDEFQISNLDDTDYLHVSIIGIVEKLSAFNEDYKEKVMESFWKERVPEDGAPNGYLFKLDGDNGVDVIFGRTIDELEPLILEHVKNYYDWSECKEFYRLSGTETLKDLLIRFPDDDGFYEFDIYAIPEKSGLIKTR